MAIKVGEAYLIEQDGDHYTLKTRHKTTNQKAKTPYTWKSTYHPNIEQCVKAIADKELRKVVDSGVIAEYKSAIDKLMTAVVKIGETGE